jgi:16S rRNA (cytosine1402-N4)-methyltransferase
MNPDYHIPVLLKSSVDGLNIKPDGIYADLTFGGGGHSSEILKLLNQDGRLLSFDQDKAALNNAFDQKNFQLVYGNFRYLKNYLKYYDALPVDGILADLGVSSHHFNEEDRGFSFRYDAPLDMRMNQKNGLTAKEVINNYTEEQLLNIFWEYGEIKNARKLVSTIIAHRSNKSINTTKELSDIAETCAKKHQEHKYFAKVFQAIRIEVNQELEVLKDMLLQTSKVLKPGGRLVIITYHSLEDRLVKNFIKKGKFSGQLEKDFYGNLKRPFQEVNRKVIIPDEEEMELNPRSRSAKLRIAERTED